MSDNDLSDLSEANETTVLDEGLVSVDGDIGPEFGSVLNNGNPDANILKADKNGAQNRRLKLKGMALKFGLSDEEVKVLASAGLMMPDIFDAILIDDVSRRNMVVEEHAGNRVQYTNLMVPPLDIEAYIDGRLTIKIDSKPYIKNAKSLSELMIAVRGSSKMLDGIASAYAEQKALHGHLLRQVVERQQMARTMRNSPPSYLIDFARLMEMLGCQRNHLRSADGRLVSIIKQHLGLDNNKNDADGEDEADYFKSWLAEENALAGDDSDANSEDVDDFDRLSRIAAKALMDGDLTRAKSAFSDLEAYDALIEEGFGAESIDDEDTALDESSVLNDDVSSVNEPPITEIEETAEISPVVSLLAEGSDIDLGNDGSENGNENGKSVLPDLPNAPFKPSEASPDLTLAAPELPASPSGLSVLVSQEKASVIAESKRNEQAEVLPAEPVMLTNWGERADPNVNYDRGDGYGRVAGSDGFGGIVSMASGVSDVIPMWLRENRPSSMSGVLGLNDWYKIEVPSGNYALVHMPRRSPEFLPVSDKMFPPFRDIERYGEEAGFSVHDMRILRVANSGRGGIDVAIRAIRSGVVMRYGKDDEDLVRFWAFLILGRSFMNRIDVLFPDGYFHGVIAPDAGAEQSGVGYLSIVRVLNDRKLSNKIRTPRFPPFDSLELVSSLDGLKL